MRVRRSNTRPQVSIFVGFLALCALLLSCAPSEDLPRPNIVLIVIDALRPDHLGCYGYGRPTSPVIDDIARTGILFETAVAPAPWTKTSFSSFLTSLYPFQHGVVGWESIMPESVVTLPEVLAASGYNTMAVVNMLGITDRFEVLKGTNEVSAAAKYKREAPKTTDDALELMTTSPEPYFIIIHYFDTHWPYRPPVKYVDLVSMASDPDPFATNVGALGREFGAPREDMVEREMLLYDACIKYVDEAVGRVVGHIEDAGKRGETVLIITADHGEAFWEHGVGSHGYSVHDEEIRVPLIFSNPIRYPQARRIDTQVSLMDLVPTIVDLVGAADRSRREGRNLNDLIEKGSMNRRPSSFLPVDLDLTESTLRKSPDTKGIRTKDWKIVVEPATAQVRLYNLRDDPLEMENVWGRTGEIGDSLLGLLQKIPGTSVNGWRLGFVSGERTAAFTAQVHLGPGHRLTRVSRLVAGGELAIDVSEDSTSMRIEVSPKRQQIILFDTEPPDARIQFAVTAEGGQGFAPVFTGTGTKPLGEGFALTRGEALGAPKAFDEFRSTGRTGAFVWWLPGREIGGPRETTTLSPEERQRLRALGYIQ